MAYQGSFNNNLNDVHQNLARYAVDNITALAGGGQYTVGSGPNIDYDIVRVSVTTSTGDSVTLPPAIAGRQIFIINAGANTLDVYPASGDAINASGANGTFAITTNKSAFFCAAGTLHWQSNLTA